MHPQNLDRFGLSRVKNVNSDSKPFQVDRVDPRLFSENDHHSHIQGSVRSQDPLTLPQNSIGRHRGDVRPDWCKTGPKFQTCYVFRDFCRAVRVDPITLGPNDHNHLRGSVRSQGLLTLPQNSIGSFRGDVRPDLCQSGLFSFQLGLLRLFGSVQGQNSPNPTQQRSNPTFYSPIPYLGIRSKELVNTGYGPRWPVLRCFPFLKIHFQVKGKNIIL
ncbi:hypothetical protein CRG98_019868 [Punica granatum]|uniref:Uncharacterized protein n=1 Tax=Punica granatum TaxID=22663 RepID=A0A2I0JTV2_PUNGR|nr:hypothetical protein CRG98_019868 [Punica granatum]